MDESKLTKDDYKFAEKIVREIDEFLSAISKEERKEFFKKYGIEVIEDDSSERKQQIIKLLTTLQAVLELRKQSDSNTKTTTSKPTYEEIMKMMEEMDFDEEPVTIVGAHPASNKYIDEANQALGASTAYLKKISAAQSQPHPHK